MLRVLFEKFCFSVHVPVNFMCFVRVLLLALSESVPYDARQRYQLTPCVFVSASGLFPHVARHVHDSRRAGVGAHADAARAPPGERDALQRCLHRSAGR